EGALLAVVVPSEDAAADAGPAEEVDLDAVRPELAELQERRAATADEARPDAVAARHGAGRLTARETVEALVDPGTFVEYGALALAAQRSRRPLEELVARTPADGMVSGVGEVDGTRCAVLAYDYTVLAGTQGMVNHRKADRLLELAERRGLPVVLVAEGGGGRPGDTDSAGVSLLDVPTFTTMARLAGRVPLGLLTGRSVPGEEADQRLLRHQLPADRVRSYDVRPVVATLFDAGSVLELRAAFGRGIVTALARLGGRPVGVLANDPRHLGGAIDAESADKAAAFLRLCETSRLPVVSLVDTPGFMVGPEAER